MKELHSFLYSDFLQNICLNHWIR